MKYFSRIAFFLLLFFILSSFLAEFSLDTLWIVEEHYDPQNPHRGWHHQEYTECSTTRETNNNEGIPSEVLYDRFPIDELIDMTCVSGPAGEESCTCEIDLSYLDNKLSLAEEAGQRLTFRFYFYGLFRDEDQLLTHTAPSYKLEKCEYTGSLGAKRIGLTEDFEPDEWIPDLQATDMKEFHAALLDSLSRYDGHPLIDYVEVGSAGHYGEWHAARLFTDADDDGVLESSDYFVGAREFAYEAPSLPHSGQIIQDYFDNFHETPLVMQIGGRWDSNWRRYNYVMDVIGRNDFGIRGDGFGDSGPSGNYYFDTSYSHRVYDSVFMYKHPADGTYRFRNQWQRGPILFENAFAGYYQWFQFEKNHTEHAGSYIEDIIDKGKDYHLSILNNKNSYLPGFNCPGNTIYVDSKWTAFTASEMIDIKERIKETLPQFLHAYGYKIKVEDYHIPPYDQTMRTAGCPTPEIKLRWNNVGVAPCYYNYYWAIKIMNEFETDICSEGLVQVSDVSIQGVLPDFEEPEIAVFPTSQQEISFTPILPNDGTYTIYAGLVGPGDSEPKITLTNGELTADENCKWHYLGEATVTSSPELVIESPPPLTMTYHYETNENIYSTQQLGDPTLAADHIKNAILVNYEAGLDKAIVLADGFDVAEGVVFNLFFDGCGEGPLGR